MRPSGLLNLEGAENVQQLVQENFELLNESLAFQRSPSKRNGVPATSMGPPANGTWNTHQHWVDSLRSLWVCSAYGAPGNWVQLEAAIVASNPVGAPMGYRIRRSDLNFKEFFWNGTAWKELYLPITGGTMEGDLVLAHDPALSMEAATKQFVEALKDARYTHTQATASTTWPSAGRIVHNFGKYPNVMIVNSDGEEIEGNVGHHDTNELVITFDEAVSGYASLS